MPDAYLLTWNPAKYNWTTLAGLVREVERHTVTFEWSCGNRKVMNKGDRVFLHRQGEPPRGIVGSGRVVKLPYRRKTWRKDGGGANYIDVEWDFLSESPVVTGAALARKPLDSVRWATQASGIRLSPDAAAAIEQLLPRAKERATATDGTESDELRGLEGEVRERMVRHRQRESALRTAKINDVRRRGGGRLVCEVPRCGFDFLRVYGALGEGFAHVHHLRPLSGYDGAKETALADLAIVCANCHAMVHRGGECRALDELIPDAASA